MLSAAGSLLPGLAQAFTSAARSKKIKLKEDSVILFQGDSITDAGRTKANPDINSPKSLGTGYAALIAARLLVDNPNKKLKVYNRGISGNKVFQLADRWDADCLLLKPDVLSIMVGVNDFWHTLTNNYQGTITTYKDDYRTLLHRTMDTLPGLQLIIAEPYAVKGVKAVDDKWYPFFNEYQAAAKELAAEFNAVFIPLQAIFDKAPRCGTSGILD